MSVVKELLRAEENGTLSFGNYDLKEKTKLADFEFKGDVYKVKTFKEITKLEKNEMMVYESEPGSAVHNFAETAEGVSFSVEAAEDVQVILGLAEDAEYEVFIGSKDNGPAQTGKGGKLVLSIETSGADSVDVEVKKN